MYAEMCVCVISSPRLVSWVLLDFHLFLSIALIQHMDVIP